ncbi:hypothetical protein DPMN_113713 [Dreissena polymorpha]|uniref:Uncharacterized protein n=1 Tax=Dreissena polymorpha TaxID=45954 RepID=A0A9D4KJJ2_DREPO|nr:hypothetical protein DPMN_113713 [Dreissena polymorpha]
MATSMFELDDIPDEGRWKMGKRCKRNTGEYPALVDETSLSKSLSLIYDELKSIKADTSHTQKLLASQIENITHIDTKLNEVTTVVNTQSELMKTLAYWSIDSEARNKRNNLLIFGVCETKNENCFSVSPSRLKHLLNIVRTT